MTTAITTRTAKGSALLWTEEDANFTNLRDAHDNAIAIITPEIAALQAGQQYAAIGFDNVADMTLGYAAGTIALVTNDPSEANNTYWRKVGGIGSGSWTKSNLPNPTPFEHITKYGSDLATAIAAIGSTPTTLVYGTDLTLTSDSIIPATLELMPIDGAKLIHTTHAISFHGSTAKLPVDMQIFSGTGLISGLSFITPTMFGAKGDYNGTTGTDDTIAIQQAINATGAGASPGTYGAYSPRNGSTELYFLSGCYKITDSLQLPDTSVVITAQGEVGSYSGVRIVQVTINKNIYTLGNNCSYTLKNHELRNDGGGTAYLIYADASHNSNSDYFEHMWFAGSPRAAISIAWSDDLKIEHCTFDGLLNHALILGCATKNVTNFCMHGCDVYNVGYDFLIVGGLSGANIYGNHFYNPAALASSNFFDASAENPTVCEYINIYGNRFFNIGILITSKWGDIQFHNNVAIGLKGNAISFSSSVDKFLAHDNKLSGNFGTGGGCYNFALLTGKASIHDEQITNSSVSTTPALVSANNLTGRIHHNNYVGFANTIGGVSIITESPGTIAANSSYYNTQSFLGLMSGDEITYGDEIGLLLVYGVIVIPLCSTNSIFFQYRNFLGSPSAVPTHSIVIRTSR